MKHKISIFLIFIITSSLAYSQVTIPFSRIDSANIAENDTTYRYFLNINNKKEACRHLDKNATILLAS